MLLVVIFFANTKDKEEKSQSDRFSICDATFRGTFLFTQAAFPQGDKVT